MKCAFAGCSRIPRALGLCNAHYQQHRLKQPLRPVRGYSPRGTKCTLAGCDRPARCSGLCSGHVQRRTAALKDGTFETGEWKGPLRGLRKDHVVIGRGRVKLPAKVAPAVLGYAEIRGLSPLDAVAEIAHRAIAERLVRLA